MQKWMPGIIDIQTRMITRKDADSNALDVARVLQALVHAQAEHNLVLLEHHPGIQPLYKSGVRYIADPTAWTYQFVQSIPLVARQGGSDCKNLVAWELAFKWRDELQPPPTGFGQRMSRCKIYWRVVPPGKLIHQLPPEILAQAQGPILAGRVFHAELRSPDQPYPIGYSTPDGIVDDPSRMLGM